MVYLCNLHEWLIYMVNVGKYTIRPMDPMSPSYSSVPPPLSGRFFRKIRTELSGKPTNDHGVTHHQFQVTVSMTTVLADPHTIGRRGFDAQFVNSWL